MGEQVGAECGMCRHRSEEKQVKQKEKINCGLRETLWKYIKAECCMLVDETSDMCAFRG